MSTAAQPRGPSESRKTAHSDLKANLQTLDRIASRFLWKDVVAVLLLPAIIILLLWAPPDGMAAASTLLALLWLLSIITTSMQGEFKKLRKHLGEQMTAATRERLKAEKFYGLSILDPLTGLYNRRFGEARLQEEMERAEKSGTPLVLIAMDFDKFKQINDQHGHAAGDLALKAFSRRLQRAIRACDVPIRIGGDEFLVILPECSQDKAQAILNRISPVEVKSAQHNFPVFFSHGTAQYQLSDTPATLTARADQRLYEAKQQRKQLAAGEQPSAAYEYEPLAEVASDVELENVDVSDEDE